MFTMRRYQDEDDYWRIRAFLREVFLKNGRRELSWQPYRFDYCRWHIYENLTKASMEEVVFLWESEDGRLAAVLHPEGAGDVFLQVHPELRSLTLEEEMLTLAEEHLTVGANGQRKLTVWAHERDLERQALLERRGYRKGSPPEHQRRRSLQVPVPELPLKDGYTVRSLGDGAELLERLYASGLAFHPDDVRYAVENREDASWYRNIQSAPLYRRDLDIVATTPDGAVASFCTVWFDDVTRSGTFEPVGTVPAHQKKGLGKAVMLEGLRRLKRLGATIAFVGSYSAAAHALYASVGFNDYDLSEPWTRVI